MRNREKLIYGFCFLAIALIALLKAFYIINDEFFVGNVILLVACAGVLLSGIIRKNLLSIVFGACFLIFSTLPLFGVEDFPI